MAKGTKELYRESYEALNEAWRFAFHVKDGISGSLDEVSEVTSGYSDYHRESELESITSDIENTLADAELLVKNLRVALRTVKRISKTY